MQQEQSDDVLSISRRAYVITKSLSDLNAPLLMSLGVALFTFFLLVLRIFFPPPSYEGIAYFIVWAGLLGVAFTSFSLIWYIIKARQINQNFDDWKEDYLEQAYILVFDTILPKGDTTGEKILNLAMAVFPELRPNYMPPILRDRIKLRFKRKLDKPQHIIVSESMNYKVSPEYSVDLALRTPDGYFIVKDFKEKIVSLEELRYLTEILSHKFRERVLLSSVPEIDIFRVICVAKTYDETLLNRQTLEKLMTEDLKASFKIDLIMEERVGYSVLWTS